jgi:hypothetical protein
VRDDDNSIGRPAPDSKPSKADNPVAPGAPPRAPDTPPADPPTGPAPAIAAPPPPRPALGTPGYAAWSHAQRQQQLDSQLQASRAALLARARARTGGDQELADNVVRHAIAQTALPPGAGLPLGAALPPVARAARGGRVFNWKLWSSDVRPVPAADRIEAREWLAAVRRVAGHRDQGDPWSNNIFAIAELVASWVRRGAQGSARITFASLAKLAQVSVDVAQRAIRFLESYGLLDTFNVLYRGVIRDKPGVYRAANLYLMRLPAVLRQPRDAAHQAASDAPPPPASEPGLSRLVRWARAFGLRERPWGLNATPLAFGRRHRPPPA